MIKFQQVTLRFLPRGTHDCGAVSDQLAASKLDILYRPSHNVNWVQTDDRTRMHCGRSNGEAEGIRRSDGLGGSDRVFLATRLRGNIGAGSRREDGALHAEPLQRLR